MERVKFIWLFVAAGLLVYANSLHSPFMLDDYAFFNQFNGQVLWNHFIPDPHQQLGIDSARTQHAYYRPLAHVIPHLNYLVFKTNPVGYHVVNIFLFSLAALAVFLLLSAVLPRHLALLAGLLFLMHPVNALMANYITASVFAVQVICLCLSLHCASAVNRRPYSSCLLFVLALLCHETSVMLPVYAFLFCLIQGDDLKRAVRKTLGLWLTLAAYALFRMVAAPLSNNLFYGHDVSGLNAGQSFASVMPLLGWYFEKIVWPVDVFLMWSKPFIREGYWDWVTMGVIYTGLAGVGLKVLWRKNKKAVLFLMWFLLGLLPIFWGAFATPYMGSLLEPHWFIPATVGLFAAVVALADQYIPQQRLKQGMAGVFIVVLLGCAWANNRLWSNEISFYERWIQANPEFKAVHYFLGVAYKRRGEWDRAAEDFQQSIAGRYKDWIVYLNLAQVALMKGDMAEAKKNVGLALKLEPRHTDIFNTLGAIAYNEHEWAKAEGYYVQAIDANRFNFEPRMNLGLVYRASGQTEKAVALYNEVLKIAPGFAPAREALANVQGK